MRVLGSLLEWVVDGQSEGPVGVVVEGRFVGLGGEVESDRGIDALGGGGGGPLH
jgi:hypothetical protein